MLNDQSYTTMFAARRAHDRIDDSENYVIAKGDDGRFFIAKKGEAKEYEVPSRGKKAKAEKPAKQPKAAKAKAGKAKAKKAAAADPAPRKLGKRAAIEEAAKAGKVPAAPDFTADTHTRFRPKLAELVALVKAKDVKGLKAYPINPISTSPKAMDKYRRLAVIALEAQARAS